MIGDFIVLLIIVVPVAAFLVTWIYACFVAK